MATKIFTGGWRKRPKDATPEKAVQLKESGLTFREIAKLWDISPAQAYNLYKKAKL